MAPINKKKKKSWKVKKLNEMVITANRMQNSLIFTDAEIVGDIHHFPIVPIS